MLSFNVFFPVLILCACVHVQLTKWTVAHQSPLSLGFPRQEFWSGLPFPPPGDPPNPRIEPTSPALAGGSFIPEPPGVPSTVYQMSYISVLERKKFDSMSKASLFTVLWLAPVSQCKLCPFLRVSSLNFEVLFHHGVP